MKWGGLAVACLAGCGPAPHPFELARTEAALRPTDTSSGEQWRYQPSDAVEAIADGGRARVHFVRTGVNAVPASDANDSGVPDFAEATLAIYDEVLETYVGWGYRPALSDAALSSNGGDGRFDVYLLDFNRAADGAFRNDGCVAGTQTCIGYVAQENDFFGYGYPSLAEASRILGSHEYFHAVQAAYDADLGVIISEGTAVWATEQYDPASSDFENFIGAYLSEPTRSLDSAPPGPVPAFAYGTALFFRFLSERFDPALIRLLYERCENGHGDPSLPADVADPRWPAQLDVLLTQRHASSFAAAFAEFAEWNLSLATAGDPLRSYRNASSYPGVTTRPATLPLNERSFRVFYAATQYFEMPTSGRTSVKVQLVDEATSSNDDTEGMRVIAAARAGGRNVRVEHGASSLTIDTSGAEVLVVGVVNTAHEAQGTRLSQRPRICVGDAAEVARCAENEVDAGVPDVTLPLASDELGSQGRACGCGAVEGHALLALAAWAASRWRRRVSHS